ncbi:hypothetical protein FB451DRAFT_1050917 [Mycena latifolia]|nr:hypothetical protein FB451DRAFT_1050917 [Mycena latifolia]
MSPTSSLSPRPGTPLAEFARVEDLWFHDGTLVLAAGRSSFRVYGGLLAKQSPVFQDMLAFPQPADAEVIDGCPVVHLEDNEDDLRCFLKALFDYEFFPPFPDKATFDTLLGVIRLSSKYQVDSLRKRGLVHLSSAFPFTPTEYPGSPSWDFPTIHLDRSRDLIRLVNFAREMSIDWILPLALYRVTANCTIAELLNGIVVDGVHVDLAPQDRPICLEQRYALATSASAEITDFLWNPVPIPRCSSGYSCTKARIESRKQVEAYRMNNILPLKLWLPEDWAGLDVCPVCKSAMKETHQEALESFWQGLPERFGCPSWDALQQMKENELA